MTNETNKKTHYYGIEWLRGIAAIMVCLYHFTNFFLSKTALAALLFQYGYLAVQAFFVISGFVIPFSMEKKGYKITDAWTFIKKRIVRIEPGYWVSIVLMLAMDFSARLQPSFKGILPDASPLNLFLHTFHINAILGFTWIREIYWTLAIDWQFFLLMCVSFWAFAHRQAWVRYLSLSIFVGLHWIAAPQWLSYHSFGFAAGMMLFYFYTSRCSIFEFVFGLATILVLDYQYMGITHLLAISSSVVIILACNQAWSPILYLGKLSYSIYLTHLFLGWTFCTFVAMFTQNEWLITASIFASLGLNIWFADFFNQKIEIPLQAWMEKKLNV
jgi:peptidoglycan/LPS O-acetylase OafA/YrhL